MAILAHRGLTAKARDNSYNAIQSITDWVRKGILLGIEIDVRPTADGLVLNHDEIEHGVLLKSVALDQLRALMGSDCPLTFAEGLPLLMPIPMVNIEIKEVGDTAEILAMTAEAMQQAGKPFAEVLVSSFEPEVVAEVKELDPRFITAMLFDEEPFTLESTVDEVWARMDGAFSMEHAASAAAMVQLCDEVRADWLNPHWTSLSAPLLEGVRHTNRLMVPWTVNCPRLMAEIALRPEIAHVITDYPGIVFPELRHEGYTVVEAELPLQSHHS